MQPTIDTRNGPRTSVHSFQNAAKGLFLGPLFIIYLVSFFGFLSLCLLSFFFEIKHVSIPFAGLSDILSQFAPWNKLVQSNVYAGLVVTALVFVGFTVVLVNMATNQFGIHCKIGFYLIKIPMFFQNILTLFSVTLITVKLVRDLVVMLGSAAQGVYVWSAVHDVFVWLDWKTLVVLTIVLVVLVAVYLLFFSYKSLMTVSVMKEAICAETPIIKQYLFTAVGYFIFAVVGIAAQVRFGFNLTLTFGCVSIALFGVFCIVFRSTMRRLEFQE